MLWSILSFPFRLIGTVFSMVLGFIGNVFGFIGGLVGGIFSFALSIVVFGLVIAGIVALVRLFVRGYRGV